MNTDYTDDKKFRVFVTNILRTDKTLLSPTLSSTS